MKSKSSTNSDKKLSEKEGQSICLKISLNKGPTVTSNSQFLPEAENASYSPLKTSRRVNKRHGVLSNDLFEHSLYEKQEWLM